jgi:hypothetical protein
VPEIDHAQVAAEDAKSRSAGRFAQAAARSCSFIGAVDEVQFSGAGRRGWRLDLDLQLGCVAISSSSAVCSGRRRRPPQQRRKSLRLRLGDHLALAARAAIVMLPGAISSA